MKNETKKKLIISIGVIQAIVIVFLFVVSIIVFTTIHEKNNVDYNGPFIGGLQDNPTILLCCIVIPLCLIFVVDGAYLFYIYRISKKTSEYAASSISEEERAQLLAEAKAEALKELQEEQAKEKNKE